MKEILLIRHGKAGWGELTTSDHNRILKKRGIRESFEMGKRIVSEGFVPDRLLVSSATRTQETADQLNLSLGCVIDIVPDIYNAGVSDLESLIHRQSETLSRIGIVGHNPTLTEAVMCMRYPLVNLPTAGVAILRFENCYTWPEIVFSKGTVIDVWSPKE